MAGQPRGSEYPQNFRHQAERELLQALLQEESIYYWNPTLPESESFFAELEQTFAIDNWLDEEIGERSQVLFSRLDDLWSEKVPFNNLFTAVREKFAERVPLSWLEAIARNVYQLRYGQNNSQLGANLKEQLVQCVRDLFPYWAEEDLLLPARPLAFSMRGDEEAIDSVLAMVRELPFSQLTEMEQARLSLAVARYAFAELD